LVVKFIFTQLKSFIESLFRHFILQKMIVAELMVSNPMMTIAALIPKVSAMTPVRIAPTA